MLKTKGIYADGMVLQQKTTNCIFGIADANAVVSLNWKDKSYSANADSDGNWKIEFESGNAGGPFVMEISSGSETVVFKDVYAGEVWVSSGQSNAQLPMDRMRYSYPKEFELPANNNIRMITVPISWSFEGEQDSVENPVWRCASPQTLGSMAGTSYFFAKKLWEELKVPVGIVNPAQGGSPIASWMSKQSLEELKSTENLKELAVWENPENVKTKQKSLADNQSKWDSLVYESDKGMQESWEKIPYEQIADKWSDVTIPGNITEFTSAGVVWFKKEITLTAEQVFHFNSRKTNLWFGTIVDADRIYVNGVQVGGIAYSYPPRRYVVPAGTLVEGKNTITVRVQKNSKYGSIRFYTEKPYCLFTDDIPLSPVAFRNMEVHASVSPLSFDGDSEMIVLDGNWKMAVGCSVEDCPEGMFFEWVPTALYNSMLAPCFNYAVAGALWYQGESDAGRYNEYQAMLCKMIELWRGKFKYATKNMPFVVVQLPNWSDGWNENSAAVSSQWASMRQVQKRAVESAGNAGIAVTIDAGEWNDLHPEKKYTTGTRSAMEALRIAYGKDFDPAPQAVNVEQRGQTLVVKFDCGKGALTAFNPEQKDCIQGFSYLYESDGELQVVEAAGKIISDTEVEVPVPEVNGKLKEIRYLWADSPNPICLYSNKGLPAGPFGFEL